MGKSSGGGSQTTTNMPPAYALPGLEQATAAAQQLYNSRSLNMGKFDAAAYLAANPDVARSSFASDPEKHYNTYGKAEGRQAFYTPWVDNRKNDQYFPGSTVANFSDQSERSMQQMEALANGGSPMLDAAQAQNLKMINGDYLNPASNPYLQAMIDANAKDVVRNYKTGVMPEIDSAFAKAGRFGSQAFANAGGAAKAKLVEEIGDIATNINYNNYAAERGYQNNAIANAGAIDDLKYNPSRILAQVGALRDSQAQAQLDDEVARYEYNRDAPVKNLNNFIAQLSGTAGNYGTQTSTAPKTKSGGLSSLVGTAASLVGAYMTGGASLAAQGGLGIATSGKVTPGVLFGSATGGNGIKWN